MTKQEIKERVKKYRKKYRDSHKEKIKKDSKKWHEENKEYMKLKNKKYYEENKKQILKSTKKYYAENKEHWRAYHEAYHKKTYVPALIRNKACIICKKSFVINSAIHKICSTQCNKEHTRRYSNEYNTRRKKEDPTYKLLCGIRTRVIRALKGNFKLSTTTELLGCTIKKLKTHLQKQFTEGMSWDNHAIHGWHIDHIKPCSRFDLSKLSEQKRCFHYTNLQPLWAEENLRKGNNNG